ncbi:MAG: hypothetical protein ACUVQY_09310, partial [Thermoproteota archaeon]
VGGVSEARENMLYASMLAGMAINCAGTVAVHGMGYYLTNYHNVHHGLANGILLPYVLKFELERGCEKLEEVAKRLGLENGKVFLSKVEEIAKKVGLSRNLIELGVMESELDSMVKDAFLYKRNLDKHPSPLTPDDIRAIYSKAIKGFEHKR